jgi:hypothetical protein
MSHVIAEEMRLALFIVYLLWYVFAADNSKSCNYDIKYENDKQGLLCLESFTVGKFFGNFRVRSILRITSHDSYAVCLCIWELYFGRAPKFEAL